MKKRFEIEIDDDFLCPLVAYRDSEWVCNHEEAMDMVIFRDNCIGYLDIRPEWCPLKEVVDG